MSKFNIRHGMRLHFCSRHYLIRNIFCSYCYLFIINFFLFYCMEHYWECGRTLFWHCKLKHRTQTQANGLVTLEQLLGHNLLHLACQPHILEFVAGTAYTEVVATTTAPQVLLSKRFQSHWRFFWQRQIWTLQHASWLQSRCCGRCEGRASNLSSISSIRWSCMMTAMNYLRFLYFFCMTLSHGKRFAAPGIMHQARWISKVIYTFKVWMFWSQLSLSARAEKGLLHKICIFFARIYAKAWHTAPFSISATNNDLESVPF